LLSANYKVTLQPISIKGGITIKTLSRKIKIGFGIGDLGGNLFFTIIGFYLLFFLTDIVHLSAALAGTVMMIGKIWDAITDPITGYYSDKTRTRWGRRRPYMFVGSVISFFVMGLMFTKPKIVAQMPLFFYMTFLYSLLNTAYTLVNIPYAALLPELTEDYNERTILTGYRMSFAVLGTFVGAAAVIPIVNLFTPTELGWTIMGYFMGTVMLITMLITLWTIKEPTHHKEHPNTGFTETFKEVLKNKVFLTALIPWTFFITGTSMVQGALVYYFAYIYGAEELFQLALVALLTMSLIFIPIWVRIAAKIGKKQCYIIGMAIMSVGVLTFSLLGELIGPMGSVVVMAFTGVGLSTHYVMPHAILPDIVEYDAVKNNVRREGIFSSIWTFTSKVGQALALALNGWILALFAYKPQEFSKLANIGIKLVCGPIPVLWYVAGILIMKHYPIDKDYYVAMLASKEES
jgi:GPH family glycoside/pentoside/hexuronide:cation symporter